MKFIDTAIADVKILEPTVLGDERGFFMETFRANEFKQYCSDTEFVQENHSLSKQGILRGLHYQIQQPQGKLVRVIKGYVFDVAVDMRRSSATFGKWVGVELSAENKRQLWIPEGFAHGFYVISNEAEFVYKCTNYYAPEHDRSLLWNDKQLNIDWPLVDGKAPLLSNKDAKARPLSEADCFS
ncbi:dTDP-4-dehydrorhamnose 3,5-epimerase [Agaribacterium sp. ZY112]|uniref:dTDP-4-dehydrorhamnose 3,5-epimerase n=1 Tax=Agaribacterium sp. ZY112 TaxID=3233574 RepID=UPI003525F0F8